MEKLEIFNTIVKTSFINIFIFCVFIKITKHNKHMDYSEYVIILLTCIVLSAVYTVLVPYINPILSLPILYLIYSAIITYVMNERFKYDVILVMISVIFIYLMYIISTVISGLILYNFNVDFDNPISNLTIPMIEIILLILFFRIKRFKNGFYFLKDTNRLEKIGIISMLIFGVILIVYGIIHMNISRILNLYLFIGVLLIFTSIIVLIKKQTTKHYKKNMRDRTISVQKAEIDEQTKLLEEVEAENLKLATAVHKYNHRLSSLELAMKSAISHNLNTEFADELSVMLKDTEDLSNSFANECNVAKCILPLTNVPSIDNMFKYMQDEASKCNINFDLKINESINDLIDNIIPKDMFETLLGDHLRDAIIAVNASDNSYKSILTTLGLVDGCYELSIYDTGIEFQIDTLLKLGKEQVTTHKDSGGSGIGFMTTFETLKTTKASLVIEEYNPETTNYTKSVSIRFDGKNQYRIYSYRADDIKKQNKEKRIIIKNIE